ncbi:MAG: class I SAM-dependent methyltransferase [Thermoplasmata archaeon]|nr:class I SAM-dependent methyltransferase [Thermoplasmata archaeon]
MGLDGLQDEWSRLAETDPLWAIAALAGTKGNRWDITEFFLVGERRVEGVLAHIRELGLELATDDVLDFGCGVGRATQAFAKHFTRCVGVDIAPPMLVAARQLNKFGKRCEYRLNPHPDLSMFGDASFDLVFSNNVLQHNPRRFALGYIHDFLRVLRARGLAVFQMLSGPSNPWLRWIPYWALDPAFNRTRTVLRRITNPDEGGWESHWIPPSVILSFIRRNGGEVISTVRESPLQGGRTGQAMEQHTYFVRPGRAESGTVQVSGAV